MILKFDIEDVKKIIEHLEASKNFKKLYGQTGTDIPLDIWFVKDHGVYLMSNGISDDDTPIIYAQGFNPEVDEDWYDYARGLGGDDFAESISYESVKKITQNPKFKYFSMNVTPTMIKIYGTTR